MLFIPPINYGLNFLDEIKKVHSSWCKNRLIQGLIQNYAARLSFSLQITTAKQYLWYLKMIWIDVKVSIYDDTLRELQWNSYIWKNTSWFACWQLEIPSLSIRVVSLYAICESVFGSSKLKPVLSLYNMGVCCSDDCALVGRTFIRLAYCFAFPAQYRNCWFHFDQTDLIYEWNV